MKKLRYFSILALCVLTAGLIFVGCGDAKEEDYSISIVQVDNGTVSADKESANEGEQVTLTVQADDGYQISKIYANEKEILNNSFVMPAKDVVIFAAFELIPEPIKDTFDIKVVKVGQGSVTVKESARVGEKVEISVQADDGYTFGGAYVNNQKLTQSTFDMPNENVTLFVYFIENQDVSQTFTPKLGTYVTRVWGETDYTSTSLDEWETYTLSMTFKAGNKFDIIGCLFENMVDIKDIVYTQQGNTVTANFAGQDYPCELLDENTMFYRDGNNFIVFCYQEQLSLANGNYRTVLDNNRTLEIEINGNTIAAKLTSQEEEEQNINLTYEIYGDRIYLTREDNQEVYIGVVYDIESSGFTLYKLGKYVEHFYDTGSYINWEILYDYLWFSKIN